MLPEAMGPQSAGLTEAAQSLRRPGALLFALSLLAACVLPTSPVEAGPADTPQEASAEAGSRFAVAFAGRVAGDAGSTRIFLDFDRSIEVSHFFMESPDRLVIDAPAILFRFAEPELIEPRGLVSGLRYGAMARDRSRIVVSLAAPARATRLEIVAIEAGKFRLVVDLVAATRTEFAALVESQQSVAGASGNVATKGDRVGNPVERREGRFTIVVDPGHGGIDGGARGSEGRQEKDLTLAVGKLIAGKVAAAGPFDVKLTRDEDVFLSLGERVAFARRNHADLVISVHADSLRQKSVRGATVYTLSREASDELAHELAQSENMSDLVAGLDNAEREDVVNDILADLTARETSGYSRTFSTILVDALQKEIALIRNPQRSASFVVLKAPEIPSVLVELGYLSNPEDEKLMTDPQWQADISAQIAEAVRAFFEPRIQQ